MIKTLPAAADPLGAKPTFNDDDSTYTLSTGKVVYAYGGAVSLCPELYMHYGWDGGYDIDIHQDRDDADLTHPEIAEICRMMIGRWQSLLAIVTKAHAP
jgi:hypothetical protein